MYSNKNNKKIVHIGYTKTATTFLQKHIFPKACLHSGYKYAGNNAKLDSLIYTHCQRLRYAFSAKKLNIPDGTLYSSESLCSYDPYYWEEYADKNLIAFGRDTHIVLVIREPKSLLSSLYVQTCIHEFNGVQDSKFFFLSKENYSERLPAAKFSLDDFNYSKLVDIYKKRFDFVTVIKYENLGALTFLHRILNISNVEIKSIKENALKKRNKSFSIIGVKIVFFTSKVLRSLNLSLGSGKTNNVPIDIGIYGKKKGNAEKNILQKLLNRFLLEFNLRVFIQGRLDKVIPYNKYTVDFNNIRQVDVLCEDYSRLPKEVTYVNGEIDFIDY